MSKPNPKIQIAVNIIYRKQLPCPTGKRIPDKSKYIPMEVLIKDCGRVPPNFKYKNGICTYDIDRKYQMVMGVNILKNTAIVIIRTEKPDLERLQKAFCSLVNFAISKFYEQSAFPNPNTKIPLEDHNPDNHTMIPSRETIPEASQLSPKTFAEDYSFLDDLQVFGVSNGHVNHNSQTPGLSGEYVTYDPQTPGLSHEHVNPQIDPFNNTINFNDSQLLGLFDDNTSKSCGNSPVLQEMTDGEFF
jgi:hypothetical protein